MILYFKLQLNKFKNNKNNLKVKLKKKCVIYMLYDNIYTDFYHIQSYYI